MKYSQVKPGRIFVIRDNKYQDIKPSSDAQQCVEQQ